MHRRASSSTSSDAASGLKDAALFAGVGVAGGSVGSVVGIGGGNVMVPLMSLCPTPLTLHQITATSLVAVVSTGSAASAAYFVAGAVDIPAAVLVAGVASATAPIGARLAARMPVAQLRLCLAGFVLCSAPLVPLKGWLLKQKDVGGAREEQRPDPPDAGGTLVEAGVVGGSWSTAAAIAASGALAGIASGLLGIGGGVVLTPSLALATDLPQQTVLGTSLAAMVLPSMVGALVHHRAGTIAWAAGLPLAVGAGLGAAVGGRVASKLPEEELRWIFSAVMFCVGSYMLRGALKVP